MSRKRVNNAEVETVVETNGAVVDDEIGTLVAVAAETPAEVEQEVEVHEPPVENGRVEAEITKELLTRKPRKKREDAGKARKRKAASGLEEESEIWQAHELETVCKTVAEVATNGLMSLSIAFARSRNNANLVMSEQDASNFSIAFRFIAKKYASVISESPEMYLLGIAVLGYAGRVTASANVEFVAREV